MLLEVFCHCSFLVHGLSSIIFLCLLYFANAWEKKVSAALHGTMWLKAELPASVNHHCHHHFFFFPLFFSPKYQETLSMKKQCIISTILLR